MKEASVYIYIYIYIYIYLYIIYSVSPKINIKDGVMHQWYMMFGQQCSISVVKHHKL